MSEEKDQMGDQPCPAQPNPAQPNPAQPNPTQPDPAQPNPAQPNPAQSYPAQAYPSPSDFSANLNEYNPSGYNAPSYPLLQDIDDIPEAPPPAYEDTPFSFKTSAVAVVNVPEEQSDFENTGDMFSFDNKSVRLGFIRKVFGILALQMAITVGLSCLFMFHTPTKDFVQNNIGVYIAAYVLFFVLICVLACCTCVARKYPCNMILLGIFTFSLAYLVAAITSFHDTKIVLMVFGITLVVCSAVMLFACQTKYDFTCCGLLFVLLLCLLLFGIFAGIFVPMGIIKILKMVYAGLGALVLMSILAFDILFIMEEKRFDITPEDYVLAAMMLYADVVCLLLWLLYYFAGEG